jgi:hypothetical protein
MSNSSTSLPQIHAPNPASVLVSKSQVSSSPKGVQRSHSSTVLPAVSGIARQSSPDVPAFFHGHTHAQAVATGQVGALDAASTEGANATAPKASVLAALNQAKEVEPQMIRSEGRGGFSDTRLRLFVKGVLPCFNPTIMEAYGAGVRDLGNSSVDPDVSIPQLTN